MLALNNYLEPKNSILMNGLVHFLTTRTRFLLHFTILQEELELYGTFTFNYEQENGRLC